MWVIILIIIAAIIIGCVQSTEFNNNKSRLNTVHQNNIKSNNINISLDYKYANMIDNINIRYIVDVKANTIYLDNNRGRLEPISFSDIIGCEIVVDDQISGGVGRAVVGAALAGEVGAVVGAMTAKKHIMSYVIKIYLNNITNPQIILTLIKRKVSLKDDDYIKCVKFADNINASIKTIIYQNNSDRNKQEQLQKKITENQNTSYKIYVPVLEAQGKISAIKKIREVTGYSLAEAKDYLDVLLLEMNNLTEQKAKYIIKQFEDVGLEAEMINEQL